MRRAAMLLFFLATGLLAGCTLGPDYRRPLIDMPDVFRFEEKEAKDVANTAWWEQFQDPILNDLIGVAIQENKDVQIAASRIDLFLGQLASTRSLLFPQVSGFYTAQRERIPQPALQTILNQYELALSASWEIDVFGRLRRQTEAARANVLASEEGRRATVLTLVSSVASSYIGLRVLDRQLEIARATADSRKASFNLFQQRFEGGTVSELELAQTRSEYEASLVAIPQIEAQIGQAEDALAVLLGRNPAPIRRGKDISSLGLPAVPAGLPSELLARRPDLRQAEQNLVAANALIGAARALYFPSVTLTGLFGSVSAQMSDLFKGPARTWSYGAVASVPVFTGGGIAGQVQQAEAQHQELVARYQQSIQSAFREVSDALITHRKSREQLVAQESRLKTLRKYLELARLRYENGYTSYIEVLDAERNLFDAETAYAQNQGAVYASLVSLYKAMGGGWVAEAERTASRAAGPVPAGR